MKKVLLNFLVLTLFTFIGCNSDDLTNIDSNNNPINNLTENLPVVVNNENSFTFTLRAYQINFLYDDELSFTSDSLVITITSLNSISKNSSFFVYDELSEEIYAENLNQNKVIVKTDIGGKIPKRAKINLINYTGELTIVVANKNVKQNNINQ